MNVIFVLIVLSAFLFAGWQQIFFVSMQDAPSPMEILSKAMITSAGGAVELATTHFFTPRILFVSYKQTALFLIQIQLQAGH